MQLNRRSVQLMTTLSRDLDSFYWHNFHYRGSFALKMRPSSKTWLLTLSFGHWTVIGTDDPVPTDRHFQPFLYAN